MWFNTNPDLSFIGPCFPINCLQKIGQEEKNRGYKKHKMWQRKSIKSFKSNDQQSLDKGETHEV